MFFCSSDSCCYLLVQFRLLWDRHFLAVLSAQILLVVPFQSSVQYPIPGGGRDMQLKSFESGR